MRTCAHVSGQDNVDVIALPGRHQTAGVIEMKNELDTLVSWNVDRGFGHTRKGVFVHASTLCGCIRPARGTGVPIGTRLFVTSELSPKGERATKAACEKCSGPARRELRDVETRAHMRSNDRCVDWHTRRMH